MGESTLEPTSSDEADLERFREFLRSAKREVDSWPEWKKNTLGWWRSNEDMAMSENESRPLERWSMGQIAWSGRTSEFMNSYTTGGEIDVLRAKAAALDKILAAWGMTWDEYRQKGSPCSDG